MELIGAVFGRETMKLSARKLALVALAILLVWLPLEAGADSRGRYLAGMDRKLLPLIGEGQEQIDVVIRFRSRPGPDDARMLVEAGFMAPFIRYEIVPAVALRGGARAIERIAKSPRVEFIELDAKIPYALETATEAGRAKGVWDASIRLGGETLDDGITGRGVGIAIVDSGVDASHPDLMWKPLADASGGTAKTVLNLKMIGRDSIGLSEVTPAEGFLEASVTGVDLVDTDTTGGHGTHVAGIAAGNGTASGGRFKGAAPGANLIGFGAGETLVVSSGLAAFDWIHLHHREQNIRVINNSWGGAGDYRPELTLTKAIQRLVNEDRIAVVFAAGNSGGDGTEIETSVWGNIPEVIQVANYYDKAGWLDDSSSRGKRDLESTWPDLAAPGTEVISTAARAKPVALYGSVQDAAINEFSGYDEPNVVPAPVPAPIEAEIAGKDVLIGDYASFTGTSMAAPFVAGVIALILEANPDLDPFQVRHILRETADFPPGRAYATDGFAIGKGLVDGGEAVAVALRMREGRSVEDALRFAHVERGAGRWKINHRLPRNIEVTRANAIGDLITVEGRFNEGSSTDQSIPFMPSVVPGIRGETAVRHFGAFGFGTAFGSYRREVFPGEPVILVTNNISSNHPSLVVSPASDGYYVIRRDQEQVAGPIPADVTGSETLTMRGEWEVPLEMTPGEYLLEAHLKDRVTGADTVVDSTDLLVLSADQPEGAQARPMPKRPRAAVPFATAGDLFSEDLEEEPSGWTVVQDGVGPGLLTSWRWVDYESSFFGDEPHSGRGHFYAGHSIGSELVNGLYYEDLADVSLISPAIQVPAGTGAKLSYFRLGSSEEDFDFLRVYIAEDGSDDWVEVDSRSGDYFNGGATDGWEQSQVELPGVSGTAFRIRFRFTSDENTQGANILGWFIDDIEVSSSAPVPLIAPSLKATLSQGIGSLNTGFMVGATKGTPDRYELDFGDGSPKFISSEPAAVGHRYVPGRWVATLKAARGSETATISQVIDVAPIGVTQVRVAGGDWVHAGSGAEFSVQLKGTGPVEVRRCDEQACVTHVAQVQAASDPEKPPAPPRRAAPIGSGSKAPSPPTGPVGTDPESDVPGDDVDTPPRVGHTEDAQAVDAPARVAGRSRSVQIAAVAVLAVVALAVGAILRRRWI